jgi:restriction system protein
MVSATNTRLGKISKLMLITGKNQPKTMTIPNFEQCMLPFLAFLGDKKERHMSEIADHIRNQFELSDEKKAQMLPSGQITVIDSRIGWARTYLKKAGLVEVVSRATYRITASGSEALKECGNSKEITKNFLKKFPKFLEWIGQTNDKKIATKNQLSEIDLQLQNLAQTPQEMIEFGYREIIKNLAQELLEKIKQCHPNFFEKLVIELLLAMGYGGSHKEISGEVVGKVGDGGIDGVIKEDRLGLDLIYIQAKRWQGVVGTSEIRNFIGALDGKKANKGVFITTSQFTKDAVESVKFFTKKVILIDGDELSRLMIENNVGVSRLESYEIKKINLDYFEFE